MFYAINLDSVGGFFTGMIAGITICFVVVLILVTRTKKENKVVGSTIEDISKDRIKNMIKARQDEFMVDVEDNNKKYLDSMLECSMSLIKEVASYYFPDSKHPEYELTIKEALDLINYIIGEFDKILDKPGIKTLKSFRLSNISEAIEKAKSLKKDNKDISEDKIKEKENIKKATKVADEAYKDFRIIKNTLNPIAWFRKVVIKGSLNAAIKKLCRTGINIVGNQANKIYSKREPEMVPVTEDFEEIYNED